MAAETCHQETHDWVSELCRRRGVGFRGRWREEGGDGCDDAGDEVFDVLFCGDGHRVGGFKGGLDSLDCLFGGGEVV